MWTFTSKNKISTQSNEKVVKACQKMLGREDVGFKDLSQFQQLSKITESFEVKEKQIAIFGIGGSSLGTLAMFEALYPIEYQNQTTFFDNVDRITFEKKLDNIKDPADVRWIIVSKSGKTVETLTGYDFCAQYMKEKFGIDICKSTTVITEKNDSPLYQFAMEHRLDWLPVPENVGGRFSIFTPVGLYPLSCLGVSLDEIRIGIKQALDNLELVYQISGTLFESLQRQEYSFYSFYYTDRLVHWGEWLQQLWSESLAKAVDVEGRPGPIVNTFIPCRGATYQHSVLQQVAEGREKKIVCFIRLGDSEKRTTTLKKSLFSSEYMEGKSLGDLLCAEGKATEQALNKKGISTMLMQNETLDTRSMSELMMTWMLVVGTLGELLGIDAYVQPGVESGKRLARQFLSPSR